MPPPASVQESGSSSRIRRHGRSRSAGWPRSVSLRARAHRTGQGIGATRNVVATSRRIHLLTRRSRARQLPARESRACGRYQSGIHTGTVLPDNPRTGSEKGHGIAADGGRSSTDSTRVMRSGAVRMTYQGPAGDTPQRFPRPQREGRAARHTKAGIRSALATPALATPARATRTPPPPLGGHPCATGFACQRRRRGPNMPRTTPSRRAAWTSAMPTWPYQ